MTFSGSGFSPREQVVILAEAGASPGSVSAAGTASRSVAARVALAPLQVTTQADAAGKFSIEVTLSEPSEYTLTAKGVRSGIMQTNTVTVQAPVAAAPVKTAAQGDLPYMGAGSGLLAFGLIGGVTVGVVVAKRSKKAEPAM